MALITSVRRLHRLYLRFPHSSPSLISISSTPLPSPAIHLSRAFHRTPHRPVEHAPHFQNSYQIVDFSKQLDEMKQETQLGLRGILERAEKAKDFASGDEAIAFLDGSGVKPDNDLIFSAIWALRDDWKLAFLAYKWGEKWGCVVHKTWCLMVWLLGNHQKFSTAWTLIHELHQARTMKQHVEHSHRVPSRDRAREPARLEHSLRGSFCDRASRDPWRPDTHSERPLARP
ncbi:pentatricopeptide repeat-containing protein [Striga asiatica]|uniref:Pentatricopeptide repeat-containing protein n=1 Tax=Striga asiatica TaxID=4170 RepID=A0A5A7QUC8_STRAF|nr:pentatricopeptide repeat-containing protein [Striga asiatica]